ncbi:ATP-binding cassette domain-containing protein [Pantoea sp. 1.19]|uniref:ABC transporter ATP-binding protein n=1 Tax=Pantoea sp. 1.19 TaxID=1925589 RepID=UPI000949085B
MSNTPPLLDVQEISLTLKRTPLLLPVSFQLSAGETLRVAGPSGCGKTTLLRIVANLLTASSGHIRLNGKPMEQIAPQCWRRQVSLCMQTPALFGQTVYDNLALPWQIRQQTPSRERLADWLSKVNLDSARLDSPIAGLSGGEKQRVALLRNLQFMPEVLLLDEVTSALDEANKATVYQLIARLSAEHNVAVLWISHDNEEPALDGRVLTLTPPGQEAA